MIAFTYDYIDIYTRTGSHYHSTLSLFYPIFTRNIPKLMISFLFGYRSGTSANN